MRVVLPEPFGPIRIVTFSASKFRDKSSNAVRLPNVFFRSLTSRIGVRIHHEQKERNR